MKKFEKILFTMLIIVASLILIYIGFKYLKSYQDMDDEGMFIFGIDFLVKSMGFLVFIIISVLLAVVWSSKKGE